MKNLVIVESPTKARTISRFLGEDYVIKFSMGHIMDLPKSTLGVDLEHNFQPELQVIADKKKLISELRAAAKNADEIILATDPDREGEAIAANIKEVLSEGGKKSAKKEQKFSRIVFHEITEGAIKEAIGNPRTVDMNLVNAQTARRVLDRLVGYKLSPLLWQKVRRGLSAGRVQSVALRLIVEREREIQKFTTKPYWSIHALLQKSLDGGKKPEVEFDLIEINRKKIEETESFTLYDGVYKITKTSIDTPEKADSVVKDIRTKAFVVADVLEKQAKRSPYAPFTTSTLQQDASRRFGFSGKRTMSLAQKLYEEGFITYHRTDSTTLSPVAIKQIRDFAQKEYGEKYVPPQPRVYLTKQKSAQEAHEAIRPTKFTSTKNGQLQAVEDALGKECAKLYELIWRRAVGSQMSDALIQSTTVYVDTKDTGTSYRLKATGSVLLFDGFLVINPQALQDKELPLFTVGDALDVKKVYGEEHETPPPPRYNDASIIQTLEEKGIGRPSTYASIISTLVDRAYVERVEKRFEATAIGVAVNDFLVKNFSTIDDVPFTASMEDNLDKVASGQEQWVSMMKDFYTPFSQKLIEVKDSERVKIETEKTGEKCPECGADLVIRTGRFGKFVSCSRFPECKFTKPLVEETNLPCPKDGDLSPGKAGKIIVKKTRKGRKFYGCSNYPNCTFASWKLEDIKGAKHPTELASTE
ncbi:MAG TPA: type I DNA topoisomerase [Patescibacteria group bacterium]|nr:type I DNA topoisomerase [Patescibacteria group bacterium]